MTGRPMTVTLRDELERKRCSKCDTWKPEDEFGKLKREPDGLNRWCRECIKTHSRNYLENDENRLKTNERIYKTRKTNGRYNQKVREWHDKNPEKNREYINKMEARSPGILRQYGQKARAKRKQAKGSFSARETRELWVKQNGCCQYCGVQLERTKDSLNPRQAHLDHVYPISRSGSNSIENLVWACRKCNQSKSDMTLEEWRNKNGS